MNEYEQRAKLDIDVSSALKNVNKLLNLVLDFRAAVIDDGHKGSTIQLDAKKAVQQLNDLSQATVKVNDSLNKIKGDNLSIDVSGAAKGLQSVQQEIDAIKKSLSSTSGTGVNLENLTTALAQFGNNLKASFEPMFKNLGKTIGKSIDDGIFVSLQKLHQELDTLTNELVSLSAQTVSINTDNAKANMESLKETVVDTKQDIMQMQSMEAEVNTGKSDENMEKLLGLLEKLRQDIVDTAQLHLDYNTQKATKDTDKLLKKLEKLKETIKQISESTINVNVTNRGFDKMIQNANRAFRNHENIVKRTATLMRQEEKASENVAKNTKKAASDQTKYNEGVSRGIARLAKGNLQVEKIRKSAQQTGTFTGLIGKSLMTTFYAARGVAEMFQQAQGFAYNIGQYINSLAKSLTSVILPAMKTLVSQGFESASTFENARISYQLFFPNENPDDIVKKIQQRAIANPVFDATDLSKYVAQLAPLTGGDSQLAIDAIEGIAAMLKASGQEVSTYMQRLVTNTQQVVSTGKATARDWNEFLRATPVFEKVLAEVTPALRTKLGNDDAELTKSDTSQLLKALQLVRTDSSISSVLDETAKNFDSLVQQFKESLQTTMGNLVKETHFYEQVKSWLKESGRVEKLINTIGRPVLQALTRFMSQVNFDEVEGMIMDVFKIIKQLFKDILDIFGINGEKIDTKAVRNVIKKVAQFIADYFKSWVSGAKQAIDTVKNLMKAFGRDPNQLAQMLGWMASPMGNLVNRMANATSGLVQIFANIAKWLTDLKKYSGILEALGANPAEIAKVSALSRVAKGLGGAITAVVGQVVAAGVNDAIYQLGGSSVESSVFGGAAQIAVGAGSGALGGAMLGSAIAPGIGTAIGAAIGGVLGDILSMVGAISKEQQRSQQRLTEIAELLKSERQKAIEEAIPDVAEQAVQLYNLKAKQNGLAEIDTNTASGYYARAQLEQYLKNTDIKDWDLNNMLKQLSSAFTYKTLSEKLDEYTNSNEFHNLSEGAKWDYKNDSANMGRVATIIKNQRLLGDYYDYDRSAEEILNSLFGDKNVWSVDQMNAFLKAYNSERTEADAINEKVSEIANYSMNTMAEIDKFVDLFGGLPQILENAGYVNAMNGLKNKIEELKNKDFKITWDGSVIPLDITITDDNAQDGKTQKKAVGQFGSWDSFGFKYSESTGGYIKPLYKASGGGISARGVDTVPALLQPGEFVVRKSVVDKIGIPAMTALNLGDSKLAAKLIGRPNVTTHNGGNSYSRNYGDNRKSIRQYVKIINRNSSATLNSYHSLGNRLALGF